MKSKNISKKEAIQTFNQKVEEGERNGTPIKIEKSEEPLKCTFSDSTPDRKTLDMRFNSVIF